MLIFPFQEKPMPLTEHLTAKIRALETAGLRRRLREVTPLNAREYKIDGKRYLQFASNDYLGLAAETGAYTGTWGSGGSRLITGTHREHRELEDFLARTFKAESAVLFNSGYAANVSLLSCLLDEGDTLLLDKACHASLVDGARLSPASLRVFQHQELESLEAALKKAKGKILVATDTVFSMDGDVAPLPEMCALCKRYGADLYADEAHAWGVWGPRGNGIAALTGTQDSITVRMGTFGKAGGVCGAAGLMPALIRDWCVQSGRGYVYSTSLPPVIAAAIHERWKVVRQADEKRRRLLATADYLREQLKELGFDTGRSTTQIIPVIFGSPIAAVAAHEKLKEQGIWVPAIRWPTVPKGTDRLRISLNSEHTKADADQLAGALVRI
jgi:8-amino-7-oxononanoate synthase